VTNDVQWLSQLSLFKRLIRLVPPVCRGSIHIQHIRRAPAAAYLQWPPSSLLHHFYHDDND
jgi:hypothetical protein